MSSPIVIKVENLSKQYRLGTVGTGTLSHDINRMWHKVRGKEDPFLKVGEENDRSKKGESEYIWALKDISFEVKKGEVLGMIGRNGAGKSTLLKILSRTTAPTTGTVKIKGRIASLLEVGTGFHPELSGRENIFLNGAILGMRKHEITKKFDEIVDFAGVERYIDTPVKRYSSGMYVRLAFAVAAYLESEILIVDEVLAVGDAEFQKKCLGKMGEVSKGQGKTVLFVSHNLSAIQSLCSSVILMEFGRKKFDGLTAEGLQVYYNSRRNANDENISDRNDREGDGKIVLRELKLLNKPSFGGKLDFLIEVISLQDYANASFAIIVCAEDGRILTTLFTRQSDFITPIKKGVSKLKCSLLDLPLGTGEYRINTWISSDNNITSDSIENVVQFEVRQGDFFGTGYLPNPSIHGSSYIKNWWNLVQ